MAIGFGRVRNIKRTKGDCAVRVAAYLSRKCLEFEGNCAMKSQTFDYSDKKSDLLYHNVLLPEGADEKFKNLQWLWNHASQKERRIDSQESTHYIMALPKEDCITHQDLIEITERFAEKYILCQQLVIQIDIHFKENNPQSHFHFPQRKVDLKKQELSDYKASDFLYRFRMMPHGAICRRFLDEYFEEKGLDLRCDPPGIISQIHLGIKGTRSRAFGLQFENIERIQLNAELAKDPKEILQAIVKYQDVFTEKDVDRFIEKYTPEPCQEQVREAFWKQTEILKISSKKSSKKVQLFSLKKRGD